MLFDKNQKQFKNDNQKRAWIMGKNIVPQKISLAKITDLPQREMFKQMYDFTVNIFSDMYENPELFNENVIQNPFGVIRLIAEFCKSGELKNNELIIPSIKPSESADGQLFSTRKECLARYGINLTENDNKSSLTSSLYPQLLPAYFLMYENAFRFKTGGWFYLAVCDFRIMEKGFAHNIDDIFRVLSDEDEIFARELHQYALSLNIKPIKCIYPQRVFYKYKGIRIMDIQIWGGYNEQQLEFTVHPFRDGSIAREENQALLIKLEEKVNTSDSPEKYKKGFLKYIRYCNLCRSEVSKCPAGVYVPVWGEKKYLCRGVNFKTRTIDQNSLDFFKTILRMRKEIIDEN